MKAAMEINFEAGGTVNVSVCGMALALAGSTGGAAGGLTRTAS